MTRSWRSTGSVLVGTVAGLMVVTAPPPILAWTAPMPLPATQTSGDGAQTPPRVPTGATAPTVRDSAATETATDAPRPPPRWPPAPPSMPKPAAAPLVIEVPQSSQVAAVNNAGNKSDVASSDDDLDASPSPTGSPLVLTGYVDVGYVKAQGNGTSFRPGDMRVPADYGVDTFAPAVNSRGEVASIDSGGLFTNGFLPRSVGIGGTPSFLINTANVDIRYTATETPVLVFTRIQLLPRFGPSEDATRVLLEQAFGRLTPFKNAELAISIGKFDSVFGIEYLDNQANFRVGITPSLLSRYTTGQSVGAKLFYRYQIPWLSSAISLNGAATNSGTFVESLQGPDRSLTGTPVLSGRIGLEKNAERYSVKLGASGVHGPRNDQQDRLATQALWGLDGRIVVPTFTLSGELVHVNEAEGNMPEKQSGAGIFPVGSSFSANGFWIQGAEELPLGIAPIRLTVYARYDHRHAAFHAFIPITVDRITGGVNVGVGENLQVKGEVLINRELEGAPQVDNNVYTSSVVWTW